MRCIALAALAFGLVLATALPACSPPSPTIGGTLTAAMLPASCDDLGDPDQRAVCESRREDLELLTDFATTNPSADERLQALTILGQEPCFALESACRPLAARLDDEPDAAARRLVPATLTCRCGPAAYAMLANAIRTADSPVERRLLIQAAADGVTSGRAGETDEEDLLALANVLVARLEDTAEDPEVRRAAAGAIPLLGVSHATERLSEFTGDADAEVRLQAQVATGEAAALIPGLLQQFRSTDPQERAEAIRSLAVVVAEFGTTDAVILEAALIAGEDPSPDVRDAAVQLDPTMFLARDRATLCEVVATHLLRGEATSDAPAELAALPIAEVLTSQVRRQVLASAALLAAAVTGPAEAGLADAPEDSDPFAALGDLLDSDDPEIRLAALAAIQRGLSEAAVVRRPADPNPVVDAIERTQGDRLRVMLSLAGMPIEPGQWEPLLSGEARTLVGLPLEHALLESFQRVAAWRIAGGDQTSERARLAALYAQIFLRGFGDETRALRDARDVEAATLAADTALEAESHAEVVIPCLSRTGTAWDGGFPRSLRELRGLNTAAAGTTCQDDALILLAEDLGTACEQAGGEAGKVVAERCR